VFEPDPSPGRWWARADVVGTDRATHDVACERLAAVDITTILFYLIVGAIVGLLGKFLAPGDKDNIPLWLTVICGIGGMLIGDIIYRAFGGNGSKGLDWTQGIVAIVTAMVLVIIASAVTGRSRSRV
jgi:uncharacterized membrane protein YeaQ/YmgE (transglycosylase-associated protein family)